MAEGNSNNSVRDRISMLVDAQEGGVRPNEVVQNFNDKPKNRKNLLKILIPVLAVAVVGVMVAIVVMNLPPRDGGEGDDGGGGITDKDVFPEAQISTDMDLFAYEAAYKIENDADYSLEDAERDFEELIKSCTDDKKYYAVTSYAFFIYNQTNDIEKASEILKSIEDDIKKDLKADYYMSISNLYKKAQDYAEAKRYIRLAVESADEDEL